jgi:hypothetical protein
MKRRYDKLLHNRSPAHTIDETYFNHRPLDLPRPGNSTSTGNAADVLASNRAMLQQPGDSHPRSPSAAGRFGHAAGFLC